MRRRGENLDLVAIFQQRAQRHHPAVDLGPHRLVAKVGVDGISEIDRGRALGQLDQLALRGEGEDAVLVHRHARMLEQLFRALGVIEDLDQVRNPRHLDLGGGLALLVGPVRRQPALGLQMHFAGADLDLDPHLAVVNHRRVERSIAVALGGRDEILEPPRDHRPALLDQPQRAVAVVDLVDDHSERHDVGQLLEADVALGHLLPDRIGMLLAPHHFGLEAMVGEVELQPQPDAVDEVAPGRMQLRQPPRDRRIGVGLELLERERLHLVHDFVHANPLGQRGIDIHRLLGDPAALVLRLHMMERAHIVQPVGELDEQHANVVAQRQQELAQILGSALILRLRLDLAELGDPVDQPRDRRSEQFLDLLVRRDRVLDRVVEDCGDDRLVVELQVGEDARDFDRMAEIGVARGPHLRAMGLHREDIGAVEHVLVGVGVIGPNLLDEFILAKHCRL